MRFIVENEALVGALALVKGCVPVRTTIPVLTHLVVEARAGNVHIRATDMERECEAWVQADVDVEGKVALPGEVLIGLARRLAKGGQAAVAMDGERCKVISGKSSYDLRTLPTDDFPSPMSSEGGVQFSMPAADLRHLIQSTSYAVCKSIAKAYYAGVYLHVVARKLKMVATDDHRLALKAVDLPAGAALMPGVMVPTGAAREMASMLEGMSEVDLVVGEALFELRGPGVRFTTVLLGCSFPPYERVVPKPNGAAATFRPYAVAEAAKRAAVVYLGGANINRKAPVAGFTVTEDGIVLEAGRPGDEQAREAVEAETVSHGLTFRTNIEYLTEMLEIWPDTVAVSVQQETAGAPVLFSVEGQLDEMHIVMPQIRD